MKILLLGKNGQVGWELQRALQPLGDVIALDRHVNEDGLCGDITNFTVISDVIDLVKPDIVVNATAYTAVDKAESERDQAKLVNHLAVQHLAQQCVKQKSLLIHYSTDYVFKGNGAQAWQEHDVTAPQNSYGQTKQEGEMALEQSGVAFINFRTSWVYATRGHNFIKTMLKLAKNRSELSIIVDQIGAPTGAALIADVTAQALKFYCDCNEQKRKELLGHYHLAAAGETSWYAYAQFVFEYARARGQELVVEKLNAITTAEYPTPAQRPLNSRLNTNKLQHTFKIHLPNWQVGVQHALEEILSNDN